VEGAGVGGDVDQGPVEVDVHAAEAGEFTEAHTRVGGSDHQHAGLEVRHPGDQKLYLGRGGGGAKFTGSVA
jgi:hypothetical protein